MDAVIAALDTEGDPIAAAFVVADHVGEQLLHHEVDAERGLLVDLLTVREGLQKREDFADSLDLAPKLSADRRHSSNPPVDATKSSPASPEHKLRSSVQLLIVTLPRKAAVNCSSVVEVSPARKRKPIVVRAACTNECCGGAISPARIHCLRQNAAESGRTTTPVNGRIRAANL